MSSTWREQRMVGRHEAAERLRTLALQIEQGEVVLGCEPHELPDRFLLEIKASPRELEFELSWVQIGPRAPKAGEEHGA